MARTEIVKLAVAAGGALSAIVIALGCHWPGSATSTVCAAAAAPKPVSPGPSQPAAQATSAPVPVAWDDSAKGIKLKYPGNWRPKRTPDFELMILPADATGDDRRITVDVPDLPPHLPFMIQMSRVEHDYVADLKKEHSDLQVKESKEVALPESKARLLRSVWRQNGAAYDDVALLIIHASAVFIVDARTGDAQLSSTRAAFDSMRDSIVWTKH